MRGRVGPLLLFMGTALVGCTTTLDVSWQTGLTPTPNPTGTAFVRDLFLGSSGGNLAAHSPDVGDAQSWAPVSVGSGLTLNGSGAVYASAQSGFGDYNTTPPRPCPGGNLVQQVLHTAQGATSDSCVLPLPVQAGSELLFAGANPSAPLQGVSGGGVTWKLATRSVTNTNVELWYGESSPGGSTSVTYTDPSSGPMICWVGELAGLATAGSLDLARSTHGSAGPVDPGALTTTNGKDLLLLASSAWHAATWGLPSAGPWMGATAGSSSQADQVEYLRKLSVPTALDPSQAMTSSSTDQGWDSALAAFKAPGPGADYAVSVSATFAVGDPGNVVAIAARRQTDGSRYELQIAGAGTNNLRLVRYAPGATVLAQATFTAGATAHDYQLQVSGSTLSVYVDGAHQAGLDVSDTALPLAGITALSITRATSGAGDVSATGFLASCL